MSRIFIALVIASVAHAEAWSWKRELSAHGVTDPRVVEVMDQVRRADFLPKSQVKYALEDRPLKKGGRLVIPIGDPEDSELFVLEKDEAGQVNKVAVLPVRFVPLIRDRP